jgi:hypothetical protein
MPQSQQPQLGDAQRTILPLVIKYTCLINFLALRKSNDQLGLVQAKTEVSDLMLLFLSADNPFLVVLILR